MLEVLSTGGMLWLYRYRLNGRQERVTLGRYAGHGVVDELAGGALARLRLRGQQRGVLLLEGVGDLLQKQQAIAGLLVGGSCHYTSY